MFSEGTCIPIITGRDVVKMEATGDGITDVVGADISIISGELIAAVAYPVGADVGQGADAPIIAAVVVGDKHGFILCDCSRGKMVNKQGNI